MPMMVDRKAPYSGLSSIMAMKGRMGDTELVHMSRPEIKALENLGQMTSNPATGLPEAFTLRDAIPAAAGIAASVLAPGVGTALFGMSPIWSTALAGGVGTGLGSLATGRGAEQSLFNAAIGFGLGGILGNLTAGADPTQGGKLLKEVTPEMASLSGQAANEGLTTGVRAGPVLNAGDFIPQQTLTRPAASQFGQMFGGATQPMTVPAGQAISPEQVAQLTGGRMGAGPVFGTGESIGAALRSPMTYAPLAGAALTYQGEEDLPPMDDMGAPQQRRFTISGGEPLSPPVTQQSALDVALGRAPARRFISPYTTTRAMAEGGAVEEDEEDPDITDTERDSLRQLRDALDESLRRYGDGVNSKSLSEEDRSIFRKLKKFPRSSPEEIEDAIRRLEDALKDVPDFIERSDIPSAAKGGQMHDVIMRGGEEGGKYFEGRVNGRGDGMSDEVEFEVEGENPDLALLSRDEYVLPADVVAMLGNGSSNAGADRLDNFVKQIRKQSFGTDKQQKELKGGGLSGLKVMNSKRLQTGGEVGYDGEGSGSATAGAFSSLSPDMGSPAGDTPNTINSKINPADLGPPQGPTYAGEPLSEYSIGRGLQSVRDTAMMAMEPSTMRGSTLAGFVGGPILGGRGRVMENINNKYYDGKARAFSPEDEAAMASRTDNNSQMQDLLRRRVA